MDPFIILPHTDDDRSGREIPSVDLGGLRNNGGAVAIGPEVIQRSEGSRLPPIDQIGIACIGRREGDGCTNWLRQERAGEATAIRGTIAADVE